MQLIDDIMSMIESEKHKKEQNLKKTLMKDAFQMMTHQVMMYIIR